MLTLSYITLEEARQLNSNLSSYDDEVLNRLIFVSERMIDEYVWVGRDDWVKLAFPMPWESTVPEEVKLACALICDGVKTLEDFWDPTMWGIIASETALDRQISYQKWGNTASFNLSAIPHTAKVLLAQYKPNKAGNSEVTGFSLMNTDNTSWNNPMNNNRNR